MHRHAIRPCEPFTHAEPPSITCSTRLPPKRDCLLSESPKSPPVTMATDLTSSQRRTLQQWGVKVNDLLYKASRDGCSPAAFHQKCDNKGPTLTLLHNTAGFVFGGCTFASWTSAGSYANDPKAFLFQLQAKGTASQLRLPVAGNGGNAIYCHAQYGPTFGSGHDLRVFGANQTFTKVNNTYFQLNGSCNLGNVYTASGQDTASFVGSDFNMTEIQVFSINGEQAAASLPNYFRVCMRSCMCVWVLVHAHARVHAYVCVCVRVRACTCASMYANMCACV